MADYVDLHPEATVSEVCHNTGVNRSYARKLMIELGVRTPTQATFTGGSNRVMNGPLGELATMPHDEFWSKVWQT